MEKPRDEKKYSQIYKNLDIKKELIIKKQNKQIDNLDLPVRGNFNKKIKENSKRNLLDCLLYDVDSQDLLFLNNLDVKIPVNLFELIFDRLEKEWYSFLETEMKKVEQSFKLTSYFCDICALSSYSSENDLLYCDGCNLCVHQECYGVPLIPEGFWLCRKCLFLGKKNVKCEFCPNKNGALKETISGNYGHILCTIYNPNLFFRNNVFLEPIEYENDFYAQPKEKCVLCKNLSHALIKCSFYLCTKKYHVTCGIENESFYFDQSNLISYCDTHSPNKPPEFWQIEDFYGYNLLSYKKLKKQPKIRKNFKLHKPEYSKIFDFTEIKPVCTQEMFDRVCLEVEFLCKNKEIVLLVCKYWQKKHFFNFNSFIPELQFFSNCLDLQDWLKKRKNN
ncbi:PHD zinc finger domain-containing protein [Tubulinosema ratisbonensis]|uniref:PHD zinc finger domain-containing protein n=1 Tax=Tubulinosema ratisbonensis TaxID=291195 RepID=A0A437AKI2_9MICR|nr:PHD zinc finger domain-containing protein [Tubulinosema ratisbonensis]